jgi:hypothetical protein
MGDHIKRCGNSFRRLACGPTLLGPQRGTRRRERRPKGDCGTREMRKHRVDEESPSLARHRTAHVLENPWLQLMVPVRQGVAYGVRIGAQLPRRGSPASHDFAPVPDAHTCQRRPAIHDDVGGIRTTHKNTAAAADCRHPYPCKYMGSDGWNYNRRFGGAPSALRRLQLAGARPGDQNAKLIRPIAPRARSCGAGRGASLRRGARSSANVVTSACIGQ